MFTGTYTAIVTPFKNGQIDEAALERLIHLQVRGGVDGIVPVGTTGESPTVSYEEHVHIIDLAVRFAAGKVKVLAGTGANSTNEAIWLTQEAEKLGADGSLQVAPYYRKPAATRIASANCAPRSDRGSRSSAATTPSPWPSWRSARKAS